MSLESEFGRPPGGHMLVLPPAPVRVDTPHEVWLPQTAAAAPPVPAAFVSDSNGSAEVLFPQPDLDEAARLRHREQWLLDLGESQPQALPVEQAPPITEADRLAAAAFAVSVGGQALYAVLPPELFEKRPRLDDDVAPDEDEDETP